jgi:ceramide glucosyltransferase
VEGEATLSTITVLIVILVVICGVGLAYLTLAFTRTVAFASQAIPATDDDFAPSITILKPVAGIESGLYEYLASFCDQNYPNYEVVFCLHDEDDPAVEIVERVRRDFVDTTIRVAFGHNDEMANPKIANLAKPGAEPNGEIVVIADSDVLVTPEYLRAVAAEFATEATGATTCLYGAMPHDNFVSQLGALHVEDEFLPSVLAALALGPLRFCMGATMAVRRDELRRIGGLEALGPYLADDHALGELVAKGGCNVTLCSYIVRTSVTETNFDDLWSHELRWARTKRAQAPAGYAFSFVMYALPFAFALLLLAPSWPAFTLFLYVAIMRWLVHVTSHRALRDKRPWRWWLIPVREVVSLAIWLVSMFGRSVKWREAVSLVAPDGRMTPKP